MVLIQIRDIRSHHQRMGTRKLYELLHSVKLDNRIKIGRDAHFDLLSTNHLLVSEPKREKATYEYWEFYP